MASPFIPDALMVLSQYMAPFEKMRECTDIIIEYPDMPYNIYSPVHTPVAFSSSPLTHVFPEPGKLARATAALLVPLMKWQGPGLAPPTLLQEGG